MSLWTGKELNEIFRSSLADEIQVTGISIDTRTLEPGDLFVPLKGEAGDGHDYLEKAAQRGASAALVRYPNPSLALPQIKVDDTLEGLRRLAEKARSRSKARVIAITGSVGKTSTKEILAQVLNHFGSVSYAHASYNNHWGVPLSLARMSADAQYAIFEIGMNNPGEISPLAKLVQPEIAIITAIAPAHIGHMGSMEAIAQEKSQIFQGLMTGGVALVPYDTPYKDYLTDQARQAGAEVVWTVGQSREADFHRVAYEIDPVKCGARMTVSAQGQPFQCYWNLIGEHLAQIALTTYGVAKALGLDLNQVTEALRNIQPIKGRGQHHQLMVQGMPIYLVDDAYNANLTSMLAGLRVLTTLNPKAPGRRIAIIGEMLELGDFAIEHHKHVIQFIAQEPIDLVFATGGKVMEDCFQALPIHKKGRYAAQAQDLIPILLEQLRPHDTLYVKGSKGSRVSLVVDALLNSAQLTLIENIA